MSRAPTKVCFVGNIPCIIYYLKFYLDEISEQQVVDIFNEVGPVLDFRLVFDRETGKPKGYGFISFPGTHNFKLLIF